MSNSKPLPPFTFDLLCNLNRDQLERFSIVCRPLKNLIDRYFWTKPYRVFDELWIRGGLYVLDHNFVQWHPNRDDYSVQQFLAGQVCSDRYRNYAFAEMRPYLGPPVRVKEMRMTRIATYNSENVEEMESIAHLWRDGNISIYSYDDNRIVSEDFHLILNSPTILQCQILKMVNANFPFKDYKILYTVNVIEFTYSYNNNEEIDPNYWQQFLEQPGVKPVIVISLLRRENINKLLDRFSKTFSSAVSPNAFKIAFFVKHHVPLTEFRETNNISGEISELKKGLLMEYQAKHLEEYDCYTLERSII